MLVWVLIVSCWGGLLLLILHDTTKDDSHGSAIITAIRFVMSVASKELKNVFNRPRSRANTLVPAPRKAIEAEQSVEKHASTIAARSPASPAQNVGTTTMQQGLVAAFQGKWLSKDRRVSITPKELELAITEAVRKTASGCDDFIGVIVHHKSPKRRRDPNWEIRGVKFGKADRKMVDEALAAVVEQLQREFRLTNPQP
jgi:hypothetical protein